MKGAPLFELFGVLLVGVLLVGPLLELTEDHVSSEETEIATVSPASETLEVWFDLRFSHLPDAWSLRQGGQKLAQGSGALREDGFVDLEVQKNRSGLTLDVRWPPTVDQGYVEVTAEAGAFPAQKRGAWGSGEQTVHWEWVWPTAP